MRSFQQALAVAVVAMFSFSVGGCAALKQISGQEQSLVAAQPLDRAAIDRTLNPCGSAKSCSAAITNPTNKDKVLAYLSQSRMKCNAFTNQLTARQTGSDTILDVGTTIASAAATAISAPLAAIHALTATAAVTSGTKSAIDNDFFAKASAENFADALQSTYYKKADDLKAQLDAETTDVDLSSGLTSVEALHELCALGPAQVTIHNTLTPPASTDTSTTETDIVIGGGPASQASTVSVQGSSSTIAGIPIVSANITAKDTAAQVAQKLATAFGSSTLSNNNVKATVNNNTTVAIVSRKTDAIVWTLTSPSKASGITATMGTPAAPASAANTGSGSSSANTSALELGAPLPANASPQGAASVPFRANSGAAIGK